MDAYHILRELAGRHEVTLLTFATKEDEQHVRQLQELCSEVVTVPIPASPGTAMYFVHTALSFVSKLPSIAHMVHSKRMIAEIQRLIAANEFDGVQVEFTQMAHYVEYLDGIPSVLDESDIAFIRRQRFTDTVSAGWKRKLLQLDTDKLRQYELSYSRKYSALLVRTEPDRATLAAHAPGKPIAIIPPWIDLSFMERVSNPPCGEDLLFYGAMWRPVNEQAAMHAIDDILPLVLGKRPTQHLTVVGSRPSRRLQAKSSQNVEITGFVDDVAEYYSRSAVVVVPLLAGAGIKGKVVQALACGRPVVTTSVGAEGIPATEADGMFVHDSPEDFAKRVLWLMEDRRYLEYRKRSTEFVRCYYDWQSGMGRLEQLYRELADGCAMAHPARRYSKEV